MPTDEGKEKNGHDKKSVIHRASITTPNIVKKSIRNDPRNKMSLLFKI